VWGGGGSNLLVKEMKKYGVINRANGKDLMNFRNVKRRKKNPQSRGPGGEEAVLTAVSSLLGKIAVILKVI